LPPSFAEVEAFAADPDPLAYERLVDRLLASPRLGERWGRYWLDVARYAETCGYERDQPKPGICKYRDWVVAAVNEDMPFARSMLGGPDAKALGFDVHGWTDRGPSPPPLHLLTKGDPKRPGPVVEPGQLSCVPALNKPVSAPPAGAKTTTRRRQLAGWIADPH